MAQSDQVPVQSNFNNKSTGQDVLAGIDLSGKTAIVTGGYSGIGLETTRALAAKGVKVIVPARSMQKATDNLSAVDGDIQIAAMDLSDQASITSFTNKMKEELNSLDLLINNAGIMANPETRIGPGWESQFGTNHMGHFALTTGLMVIICTEESGQPTIGAASKV